MYNVPLLLYICISTYVSTRRKANGTALHYGKGINHTLTVAHTSMLRGFKPVVIALHKSVALICRLAFPLPLYIYIYRHWACIEIFFFTILISFQ